MEQFLIPELTPLVQIMGCEGLKMRVLHILGQSLNPELLLWLSWCTLEQLQVQSTSHSFVDCLSLTIPTPARPQVTFPKGSSLGVTTSQTRFLQICSPLRGECQAVLAPRSGTVPCLAGQLNPAASLSAPREFSVHLGSHLDTEINEDVGNSHRSSDELCLRVF